MSGDTRVTAYVHGHVQGVGFRWWTRSRALELGLVGYAANQADGRVRVVAEGPEDKVVALIDLLRSGRTPGSVDLVVEAFDTPRGDLTGFVEK
ncbi:acylphosphatase [Gordonia desulfuricans]|uniref:Acylphosphatase n=1 Tax=Gordonia desulfuricans TaxID=89051 RepID=A0A7K3LTZ2_9ACTN|nr:MULTISPECIES: acylphosphatase [Gordonia]EMP10346.1 acylphosphatase [Gordonia sp. NB41Y]NDK91709.1 acylphosphatase [Gordonia desulfuricans]WLP91218.1 acylphosphatase [Gordonia sp. NB41Y]